MDKVKDSLANLGQRWRDLSRLARIAIILGLVSLLMVGGIIYYLQTKVDYGVLFSNLSQADAGKITEQLEKENVAYKLADNGSTILVDKTKIDQERINLAMNNDLPNTSKGFELFDSTSVMTTDQDRKILYQRALQGELQNAIQSLDAVSAAKVILVMPNNSSVFSDSSDNNKAKASITLTLKNGTISNQAVRGIVSLTTGAVNGLSPSNVKVVDSNGNVLNSDTASGDDNMGGSSKYIAMQNKYASQLEKKIRSLLQPTLGDTSFTVSVNASLDFNAVENKTTTYANPQVRSEATAAGGDAATVSSAQTANEASNVANVTNQQNGNNASSSASYSHTQNNELDTSVTKTIQAPGTVKRLTTSVLVNRRLSRKNRADITRAVQAAIGFDAGRGDAIVVQGMTLNNKPKTTATPKATTDNKSFPWLYLGIGGVILALVIGGLTFFMIRRRRAEEEYYDDDYDVDVSDEEAPTTTPTQPQAQARAAAVETPAPSPVVEEPKVSPEVQKQLDRDEQARNYAKENPEIAADLIKAWMKDETNRRRGGK